MESIELGHEVGSSLAAHLPRKQPSYSRTSLCTTVEAKTKENRISEVKEIAFQSVGHWVIK